MNTAPLAVVLDRIVYLQRLRTVALELYERTDCAADRVRASEVAATVGRAVDDQAGPYFRRDLAQALKFEGIKAVTVGNVRSWVALRRRKAKR